MKKGRRPYQKPRIEEIKLAPEEAVLANCKSSAGTNKNPGRCQSVATCKNGILGS